ncbi:hypothetical protein MAPG_08584 [Magnaporthiopsis poae ATCC 64411]|uniref:Heterokaryon incompatibility domain-containing protein n=1 Tax=Magnaporthiopsis poae (strain ATCC 64411 / 73-15) TaxID=644358 RepID=A0A0C4E7R4_MAGP6|nr:hypothetical protein MAPG_08584 [Magnaporthiopsis poae ATCC 64411]
MEPYRHEPIDLSKKAIRLLHLLPGPFCNPIRCSMYQSLLEKGQCIHIEYEALSYTWGSSETSETIYIDGKRFRVTKNLHTALQHLRYEKKPRFLWVDAICIDQSNGEEQGHQVGQMGTVYSSAERTLVWLGPQSPETHFLFGLIKDFHERAVQRQLAKGQSALELWRQVWEEDMLHETRGAATYELWHARREELYRLLRQPWFSRVWVIQEVALARRAEIVCGHLSVPTSAFALIPSLMGEDVPPRAQALLDVMPGPLRKSGTSWWNAERDLCTILQKFAGSEASRPRDRIYALLSVSSDTSESRAILPDYLCGEEEAVQGVLRFLVSGDHPVPSYVQFPRWTVDQLLDRMSGGYDDQLQDEMSGGHNEGDEEDEGLGIWGQLLFWALQGRASPALAEHIAHTRLPYVNVGGPKRPDPILHVLIRHYPNSTRILRSIYTGEYGQELDLEFTYQGRTVIAYALYRGLVHVAVNLWGLGKAENRRTNRRAYLADNESADLWSRFSGEATRNYGGDSQKPLLSYCREVVNAEARFLHAPSSETREIAALLLRWWRQHNRSRPFVRSWWDHPLTDLDRLWSCTRLLNRRANRM